MARGFVQITYDFGGVAEKSAGSSLKNYIRVTWLRVNLTLCISTGLAQ